MLRFTLPRAQWTQLDIFDLMGRKVRTLSRGQSEAGEHLASWDGRNEAGRVVATGTYVVRLKTIDGTRSRRLAWLR